MPSPAEKPIARWLRSTRQRQRMVDKDGEERAGWTVEHLIEEMRQSIGWAPARPNYSKYETGKATPKPPTLRKFVKFWELQGEPGPDLTPQPDPEPAKSDVAAAIDRQTKVLEQILGALSGQPLLTPGAESWAVELLKGRGWQLVEPGTELPHRGHGHGDTPASPTRRTRPQTAGTGTGQ